MKIEIPHPGSDEAIDQGCTCPILDNEFGSFEATGGMFYMHQDCPLHGWELEKDNKGSAKDEQARKAVK